MKFLGINWQSDIARGISVAGIFATAGVLIGFLLIPPSPTEVDPTKPGPEFTLLGQKLSTSPDASDRALQLVRRYASSSLTVTLPGGAKHTVSRASLGAEVQRERLTALVKAVKDPASPMRKRLMQAPPKEAVRLPVPVELNVEKALTTLLQLKDRVDRPAIEARMDLESRKMLPDQEGLELDVHSTLSKLITALRNGDSEVEAVVIKKPPRLKADQLANVSIDHVLGYFETNYARGEKSALRTFNLRLAASKLDGHVILPGETFDFNEVVGPRDEAHGYKDAPVIAEGELVDGIGGGTCQIAGTLHGAAFFAGLKVLSRRPHTRPSGYIKMGLDAAVSYPAITLRLQNPFDYPVVLHETVKDGVVRAEILGPPRKLTVTYVRKILKYQPYEELERPDPKLPKGVKLLSQRGIPGFKIQRYRIVRDGPFAVRESTTDTYPPTNQIIRVGTGDMPKDSLAEKDDNHPEYVADEYLVVTQGPGIRGAKGATDDPEGAMVEQRVQGQTGVRGWTEKAGYPYYKSANSDAESCGTDDPTCQSSGKTTADNGKKKKGKGTDSDVEAVEPRKDKKKKPRKDDVGPAKGDKGTSAGGAKR